MVPSLLSFHHQTCHKRECMCLGSYRGKFLIFSFRGHFPQNSRILFVLGSLDLLQIQHTGYIFGWLCSFCLVEDIQRGAFSRWVYSWCSRVIDSRNWQKIPAELVWRHQWECSLHAYFSTRLSISFARWQHFFTDISVDSAVSSRNCDVLWITIVLCCAVWPSCNIFCALYYDVVCIITLSSWAEW